jgi:hypothetical protein
MIRFESNSEKARDSDSSIISVSRGSSKSLQMILKRLADRRKGCG